MWCTLGSCATANFENSSDSLLSNNPTALERKLKATKDGKGNTNPSFQWLNICIWPVLLSLSSLLLPQSERIFLFAICVENVSTLRTVEEILLKTSTYKLLPPPLAAPAVAAPNICSLENNKSFNPKSLLRTLVFKQAYRNLFSLNLMKPSFNRCSTGASVSVISTCE